MTDGDDDYERLFALVDEARRIPRDERDAWLGRACGDDRALIDEVHALLVAGEDDSIGDAFADSKVEGARRALDGIADRALAPQEPPDQGSTWLPEEIGGYRILRKLGQGGMGIVYEAEQSSPSRRVAIKLLHPMHATPERLRRFRQEAAVLGRLQHPGIAQIFEAGTFDVGHGEQSFFAMELVDGVDIRTYCERGAGIDRAARINLLARVADAVQYAHEHGVIHRDLKPDNVLVDADGNPRILDFGIARASSTSATLSTIMTEEGQLVGTLAYMSPEQLEQATDAITPKVDVYALGVLGFELLVGRLPREIADLSLSRAIALLATSDAPRAGTLDTSLRGDLETILGKALESDPRRRYASAAALASDLRRHIAHHPILARAPSRLYLARKFTRRHRGLVAGAVATLITLITGTVVALIFAARASSNAERALASQNDALNGLLQSAQVLIDADRARDAVTQLHLVPEEARGVAWRLLDRAVPYVIDEAGLVWMFVDDEHLVGSPGPFRTPSSSDAVLVHSLVERRTLPPLFRGQGFIVHRTTPSGFVIAATQDQHRAYEYALLDLEHETILERSAAYRHVGTRLSSPDGEEQECYTQRIPEVSDDGRTVLWYTSASEAELRIEGVVVRTVRDLGVYERVHIAPDGRTFLVNRQEEVAVFEVESGARLLRFRGGSGHPGSGLPVTGGILLDNALEDGDGGRSLSSQGLPRKIIRLDLPDAGGAPLELTDPFRDALEAPVRFGNKVWFSHSRDGRLLAFYADVAKLVTADSRSTHEFGALATGRDGEMGWIPPEAWRRSQKVMVSPTGKRVAVTGTYGPAEVLELDPLENDPTFDLRGLTLRGHVAPGGATGNGWVYDLALSGDGSLLASSAPMDPFVRIWDTQTGVELAKQERPVLSSPGHSESLMAFRAGNDHLVMSQKDTAVSDWNLLTGEVTRLTATGTGLHDLRSRIDPFIDALDPVADARLSQRVQLMQGEALVVSPNGIPEPGQRGRHWRNTPSIVGPAAGLGTHPSLPLVAVVQQELYGGGGSVDRTGLLMVIDTDTGVPVLQRELDYKPWCVAYSPDGETLAIGTSEGYVLLFETQRHTQQLAFSAHDSYVYSILWTPDGTRLVTASGDETVRIWDSRTRAASRLDHERWQALRAEVAARPDLGQVYEDLSGEARAAARVELLVRAQAR